MSKPIRKINQGALAEWKINISFRDKKWFKHNWPGAVGLCVESDIPNGKIDIYIQTDLSSADQIGVLYHEFTHAILTMFLGKLCRKPDLEERFADGMDLYGKALFNWFMNKNE